MGEPDMLSLQTPCLLEHCSFFQCTRLKKSILLLNHSSIPLHLRTAGTPQTCCFRASAEKSLDVPVTAWGAVSSARTVNDTLVSECVEQREGQNTQKRQCQAEHRMKVCVTVKRKMPPFPPGPCVEAPGPLAATCTVLGYRHRG